MFIKTAFITSDTNDEHWSQGINQGNIFLVIELNRPSPNTIVVEKIEEIEPLKEEREDIKHIGHTLLTRITEHLLTIEVSNASLLKKTLEPLCAFPQCSISLCAAVLTDTTCFAVTIGGGHILIKRGNQTASLASHDAATSGTLEPNDQLYLLSPTLFHHITRETFAELDSQTIDALRDMLGSIIHKQELAGAAGCIIKTEEGTKPIINKPNPLLIFHQIKHRFHLHLPLSTLHSPFSKLRLPSRRSFGLGITILCILLVLLGVSVFFGFNKKKNEQAKQRYARVLDEVNHNMEEVQNLVDINDLRARDLIVSSKDKLRSIAPLFPKDSPEKKQIDETIAKLDNLNIKALKLYTIKEPSLFFDLTVIKSGARGVRMSFEGGTLAILDTGQNSAYTFNILSKQSHIIAGGEKLHDPQFIALSGNRVFIFTTDGIILAGNSKPAEKIVSTDSEWGNIADIGAFANNLYLVDDSKNELVKYPATEEGLGEKILYLPNDASHQFTSGTTIAIDGIIWTITGSTINKFIRGVPDGSFALHGMVDSLSSDTVLRTTDDAKNLYILDRGKKRVVVVDKEGNYQAQYVWSGIDKVTDFAVSEEQKKILLLSGSSILAIEVK